MTGPASALDIPEDEPRAWRGVTAAAAGSAAWVGAGVVLARTFALGGWQRPWLAVGATLAVPAALLAWVLAGPHARRTALTAATMVLGVALVPLVSAGATPSPARLSAMVDDLGLPGETVREVHVGSGRCRPECSEIRRTSVAKGIAFAKVRAQLAGILRASGFDVRVYSHDIGEPVRIDAAKPKLRAQFALVWNPASFETRISSVVIARGPASDHEVG